MPYNLRETPLPSQRRRFDGAALAEHVATHFFGKPKPPPRPRIAAGSKRKRPAQTPARNKPSQISLPTPETASRGVVAEEDDRMSEGHASEHPSNATTETALSPYGQQLNSQLQPLPSQLPPPASHQPAISRRSIERALSIDDDNLEELEQEEEEQTQDWPALKKPQSARVQEKQPTRDSPTPYAPIDIGDIRASIRLVIGANYKILTGWRSRIDAIDIEELKTTANAELKKQAAQVQRPGYTTTTNLSAPTAAITARGVKPIYISVDNEDSFDRAKEEINELLSLGKQAISITITFRCHINSSKQTAPEAVTGEGSSRNNLAAGTAINTHTNTHQQRHDKETAAQRQRRQIDTHQQIAAATNSHILELTSRYQCRDKSCANYNRHCFSMAKLGHLFLSTPDLVAWCEAINGKRTTVAMPPADVVASVIARRSNDRGKKGRSSP